MKLAVKDSLNQFSPLKVDILYNSCKLVMASKMGTWDPYYQDPHFSRNMVILYENGDLLYG